MKVLWRRRALAAALSLTAAVGGLLVAGTAQAQTVSTGSLSFRGDSGDYISQGKSYSYSTGKGDGLTVSSSTGSTVSISVNAYNGDWWTLTFDAPGTQVLVPRTYTAAHRHPFNGTGPGLDLSGEGRGCNELTGSFTISKAVFGPQGYVQAFDATFEQHCEGGTPAARGEVHISNRPPPSGAAPKPATTRPRAATTSPNAGTKPKATPTGRHSATPTSRPSATPTSAPSATAAGIGNTSTDDTDANTAAVVRNTFFSPLLLVGVLLIVLAGLVAMVGLAVVLGMYVRRQ
ncbi:hypothetical protein FXF50_26810 [Micromonospora sp. AP08]|uniref:hypothetical protein n=1 Tax=Micromonospora sp. AP08 TaxID=2604467 RepID=UPI0011DBE467|nr:hypothetical protein [Micromonospora sp. AP08]TYB34651.1 hypothetical protein FXF50_26810 [Micromonospora sp. AP08]